MSAAPSALAPRVTESRTVAAAVSFALPVFLGAFLLFQIQPMVARRILPWFGGGASVWTACMLFFQVALLGGYLYAHVLVKRLSSRAMLMTHLALIAASLLCLPVMPSEAWKPTDASQPVLKILVLLAATVGLPYMTLATTSPVIQSLYARRFGSSAYRLFALSNVGSMLGLLSYPVLIEPAFTLQQQSWVWAGLYLVYAAAVGALMLAAPPANASAPQSAGLRGEFQLSWILLPACASTLLLAATNYLTQNVTPTPFLWILPLAAYIASFILAFDGERWYSPSAAAKLGWLAVLVLLAPYAWHRLTFDVLTMACLITVGVFVVALVCHGETVRRRPAPEHLTRFYLGVSIGGAVGGVAVGVIAPLLLPGTTEYLVSILICAVVTAYARPNPTRRYKMTAALATFSIAVVGYNGVKGNSRMAVHSVRNFYGSLRVQQDSSVRQLLHGATVHGSESRQRPSVPTAYFAEGTGIHRAIEKTWKQGQRVGIIGLGAGTIAAWSRPGDEYTFYELDPDCVTVAREWFTFLNSAKGSIRTVAGDGRLELERDTRARYDVLAVDAFSGDSVPAHLLTTEALELYLSRLADGGIVALHISTLNLDLEKVVSGLSKQSGLAGVVITAEEDRSVLRLKSKWALLARRPEDLPQGRPLRPESALWTDESSSLWPILRR